MELRVEVRPASAFRLPRMLGKDGVTCRRGGVIEAAAARRARGAGGRACGAERTGRGLVRGARAEQAERRAWMAGCGSRWAWTTPARVLQALRKRPADRGSLRKRPWLRVRRRPEPFEALVWAVCEQLIDYDRAAAIQTPAGGAPGAALDGRRSAGVGERAARPADGSDAGRGGTGKARSV